MTSFDNNEDKVCSFLKDNVGGSYVKSFARSHDPKSYDQGVTQPMFFFTNFIYLSY